MTNLKHAANGVEQPPVGIDLLLILRLEDQNYLYRHEVVRVVTMGND